MDTQNQKSGTPLYLISFLGTTPYTPCCYVVKDAFQNITWDSGAVKYVQTAVLEYLLEYLNNTNQDRNIHAYIFCTAEALANNWNSKSESKPGTEEGSRLTLPEELQIHGFHEGQDYEKIDIGNPFTEEDTWALFNQITEKIPQNAEIVFDITHSFRNLPMVMSILLNYLKVTKHIQLQGCYYGAFEQLLITPGTGKRRNSKELQEDVKDPSERKAELVSLGNMFRLNEWTQAVHDFEDLGDASALKKLADATLNPELTQAFQDKDASREEPLNHIKTFVKSLYLFSQNVRQNRLQNGSNTGLQNTNFMKDFAPLKVDFPGQQSGYFNALIPLLKSISDSLLQNGYGLTDCDKSKTEGALNGIRAAWWALQHDLIPQSLTLLEEALISYFTEVCPDEIKANCNNRPRYLIGAVLAWGDKNTKWNGQESMQQTADDCKTFLKEHYAGIFKVYDTLSQARNDINHAGTSGNGQTKSFEASIRGIFTDLFRLPCFSELNYLLEIKPH